eukprot:TRINITY_DN62003_c0_g1_i1.p1 TRINITY_DN62003_c0_g1~~TRINITY_DN62003_c0_g1_i1.p1  ORF type:complete len:722 (+),score=88.31 TRINITY_DN62003_c0_g1_i1:77-2242(+)
MDSSDCIVRTLNDNRTARWMWGDAGVSKRLARANPWRWSCPQDLSSLIPELEDLHENRPILLEISSTLWSKPQSQLYEDPSKAIQAIQESVAPQVRLRGFCPPGDEPMSASERLYTLIASRSFLAQENYFLYPLVKAAQDAAEAGLSGADALVDRLESELESELKVLVGAFMHFNHKRTETLGREDMKNMNRYLGFPASDEDIDHLMKLVDTDGDGRITLSEFDEYVGRLGGSKKLYAGRQLRISEKMGGSFVQSEDLEALSDALDLAGVDAQARAYWRLVAPGSEFCAVAALEKCQAVAVARIRRLAKRNHEAALPKLQERLNSLGIQDEHLWLTLAWIRELAPVICHIHLDKLLEFMENDTHYRNQFETNTSGGLLRPQVRELWERDLFDACYDGAAPFDRPKYGVQNVMNDHRGVTKCIQYGASYITLKDVRLRCTFSPQDSANLKSNMLAVPDFYAHVLSEYSDVELQETVKIANSPEAALLGDSDKVGKMKYKEAQIHGEIAWAKHVDRLVADIKHREDDMEARLKALCKKHGWGFSWMDEEQARMRQESGHTLGGCAWRSRLQALQENAGDVAVPDGFCKVGCSRRVAPGRTRSGKPFTTCCRGCVMGFGHDRLCGKIDRTKVGPGLCANGCGLKVSTAKDSEGRAFTTCCRGCALGRDHDAMCQRPVSSDDLCRNGCGRPRAAGQTTTGRSFDTCCRGCATGQAHSPGCVEKRP